jgi:uncharacterized protein (TIRG00374 family)
MRSYVRTVVVLAVGVALVALFLRNVDLWRVGADIVRARPDWLLLSLATAPLNLVIRAYRWQYLLEPLGSASFGAAFRATAVGFAASSVLPARAGEVIRPYFLARQTSRDDRMSATGAFATIILERLLDIVAVLVLLASYVLVFGRQAGASNPTVFRWLKGVGLLAAAAAVAGLVVLFLRARDPAQLRRFTERLSRTAPAIAGLVGGVVENFALGLGAIRRPGRLLVALLWSFPLWLTIALGLWTGSVAFQLDIPFTGTFPIIALLAIGVAVPTPGAVGGFHAAFRYGATTLFGAPDDAAVGAAIVLHLFSVVPALLLGLLFAAQAGLSVDGMRRLAGEAEPGRPA